jgi:mono/diheme cytochrome c family protein
MPSAVFSTVTDAELAAVLAFVRSRPPGGAPTPDEPPGLLSRLAVVLGAWGGAGGGSADPPGPAGLRSSPVLVAAARMRPPLDAGREHARGRHIARTVCTECHGSDLSGDPTEGAPDLMVAAAYEPAAFRRLLRTGVPPGGRDLGIMSETAREDFRVFTDAEIEALHGYLRARAERVSGAGSR